MQRAVRFHPIATHNQWAMSRWPYARDNVGLVKQKRAFLHTQIRRFRSFCSCAKYHPGLSICKRTIKFLIILCIHTVVPLVPLQYSITKTSLFKFTENIIFLFKTDCSLCFWAEIRTIMYTPVNSSFTTVELRWLEPLWDHDNLCGSSSHGGLLLVPYQEV